MESVSVKFVVPAGLVIVKTASDAGVSFCVEQYEGGELVDKSSVIASEDQQIGQYVALATALSECPGIPVGTVGEGPSVLVSRNGSWESDKAQFIGVGKCCRRLETNVQDHPATADD